MKPSQIAGWVLSVLLFLALTLSAAMKFARPQGAAEGFEKLGWPVHLATPLGIVELACAVLFLIPRTSGLGAVLLTGYFGGAIATHARVHDPIFVPAILGVLTWIALLLRDSRIAILLPWSPSGGVSSRTGPR
jgi:uncharacterized membrane protein YphA (DoxX/SURF4 family)